MSVFRWVPLEVQVSLGLYGNIISARANMSWRRLGLPTEARRAGDRLITCYGWSKAALIPRLLRAQKTLADLDHLLATFAPHNRYPLARGHEPALWPQGEDGQMSIDPGITSQNMEEIPATDEEAATEQDRMIWESLAKHQQGSRQDAGRYRFEPDAGHDNEGLYFFPAPHANDAPIRMDLAGPRGLRRLWTLYAPPNGADLKPWSVNRICDEFEIPRSWFMSIKAALRLTHDSMPAPPEDVARAFAEGKQTALAQDVLASASAELRRQTASLTREQNDADARKWRDFERSFTELAQRFRLTDSIPAPPKLALETTGTRTLLAFDCTTDVHVEALGYDSSNLNPNGEDVDYTQQAMIQHATRVGKIHTAALLIGSDFLDVDTYGKTTTKGTPQVSALPPEDIPRLGWEVTKRRIQRWRAVADRVVLLLCPGNHDKFVTSCFRVLLHEAFDDQPDVDLLWSRKERVYLRWGATLIGATHGDTAKAVALPELMLAEAPSLDGVTRRIWVRGHDHVHQVKKRTAVEINTAPALSPNSTWAAQHFGLADREAMLLCVDPTANFVDKFTVRVPAQPELGANGALSIDI